MFKQKLLYLTLCLSFLISNLFATHSIDFEHGKWSFKKINNKTCSIFQVFPTGVIWRPEMSFSLHLLQPLTFINRPYSDIFEPCSNIFRHIRTIFGHIQTIFGHIRINPEIRFICFSITKFFSAGHLFGRPRGELR